MRQASIVNLDVQELSLGDLPTGQAAHVLRVAEGDTEAAPARCQALADLGFTPGERVLVLRRAWPAGEPLAVRVGTSTFALRQVEAAAVRVSLQVVGGGGNGTGNGG